MSDYVSVFDLFKIGIGPSSSHVVGPMRAALAFTALLRAQNLWPRTARLQVTLYGSLAWTGKGHGTDTAFMLGLMGHTPDGVDPDAVPALLAACAAQQSLLMADGGTSLPFLRERDIVFNFTETKEFHSNAAELAAFDAQGALLLQETYYSVGGGFVLSETERRAPVTQGGASVPYPFASAAGLLALCQSTGMSIAELVRKNECALRNPADVDASLDRIVAAMQSCIERGLRSEGMLPGALKVKRRAAGLYAALAKSTDAPLAGTAAFDWLSAFAMAVNEENAAGGRVVTAPTNGAAGVLPAVLRYYLQFEKGDAAGARRFLLAAAAVGGLCKMNASISGAEVGCQGEVGSAAAMAAAGMAAALGASDAQVENAAEIALEHHLGMTCDPVGGLVQVPCIERNALGAIKAVAAASLSMRGDGTHVVTLDQVIETMRQTGADMQHKYKETALGGLAVNVVAC